MIFMKKPLGTTGFSRLAGILAVFMAMLSGAQWASAQTGSLAEQIRERISPPGQVCVHGQPCAAGVQPAGGGTSGGEPRDPEMIYQTFCVACHGTGANDSPVLGEIADWEDRIEKGVETLYENAINGFNNNAMPARGLCNDCSDEEIRSVVDYMLDALE